MNLSSVSFRQIFLSVYARGVGVRFFFFFLQTDKNSVIPIHTVVCLKDPLT